MVKSDEGVHENILCNCQTFINELAPTPITTTDEPVAVLLAEEIFEALSWESEIKRKGIWKRVLLLYT
jgi:PHD/YefM family antitoxin component YafN of YafNO toxin-antitoxin module